MRDGVRTFVSEATNQYRDRAALGRSAVGRALSAAAGIGAMAPRDSGICGIPQDQLTPSVQAALTGLFNEIAGLREDLRAQNDREAVLRQRLRLAESFTVVDSLVELRTRHAFAQELARMIAYADGHARDIVFVLIRIEPLSLSGDREELRLDADILRRVASALTTSTRTSDLLGRLGEDAFGAVLMDTNEAAAARIGTRICEKIAGQTLGDRYAPFYLSAAFGLCRLAVGTSLEDTFASAERDLKTREIQRARVRGP